MKRHRPGPAEWPAFDSPLLQEIVAAFRTRSKAIRYQVLHKGALSCVQEFCETAAGVCERLDLVIGSDVRLCVWADGAVWFCVCVRGLGRNSGWAFQDSFHGTTLDVSPQSLVGMVEATLALPFGTSPAEDRQRLREVWQRVRPFSG